MPASSQDIQFLKLAVENSKKSTKEGNFPAGAVVVKHGKILSSQLSSPYPGLLHPDSKAVYEAFQNNGLLTGATLYIGLQPCLMCMGVTYWSGIRRVVFAVLKSKISGDYYETPEDTAEVIKGFNEQIEFVHIPDLEDEALDVVREWESKRGS